MALEDKKSNLSSSKYNNLRQRIPDISKSQGISPVDHAQLTWRTNPTLMSVSANIFIGIITFSDTIIVKLYLSDISRFILNYELLIAACWSNVILIVRLILSGNSGDSLSWHRGMPFTTKDQDNDNKGDYNCAFKYQGAWWYKDCHHSNLNGLYHRGNHSSPADGVNWKHWKGHRYSLKKTEMKIRPVDFWTAIIMAQQWYSANFYKRHQCLDQVYLAFNNHS